MKVVILAGGYGTRLSEYTETIPKPMVTVGNKPILVHIMNHYSRYGYNDFVLALGYKSEIIKEYFVKMNMIHGDLEIDFSSGGINGLSDVNLNWKVSLIDTGQDTMTGGRLSRLSKIIGNEPFMMTYGDGVSDVPIDKLLKHHFESKKIATVTAVRPTARFGELDISNGLVASFREKSQMDAGWINGGFFVLDPKVFDFINNENVMFEREPIERLARSGELAAYLHDGFWQCMDSKRDKEYLENLWDSGAPWLE